MPSSRSPATLSPLGKLGKDQRKSKEHPAQLKDKGRTLDAQDIPSHVQGQHSLPQPLPSQSWDLSSARLMAAAIPIAHPITLQKESLLSLAFKNKFLPEIRSEHLGEKSTRSNLIYKLFPSFLYYAWVPGGLGLLHLPGKGARPY